MASIAENLKRVGDRLHALEHQYQRPPDSVRLLAVSKTHSADRVAQAWHSGVRNFGENYVQEALDKISALTEGAGITGISWHFIGPLQSNKTRDVAEHFNWVHSVDRLKIARRLSEQRPPGLPALNVCVQVNISNEHSKSGVSLADTEALCRDVARLSNLRLRGLMAIPAPCDDLLLQRSAYRPLAALFQRLAADYGTMDTLSIGMSDDLEAAIAEGSTMVRVGTAIFGPRVTLQSG